MSALTVFNFHGSDVRISGDADELWFIATDLCEPLGYRMASDMTRILDEDEKGTHIVSTPGGLQEVAVISEPGVYKLVARSRKPQVKEFDRFIRHEVLPQVRRTGAYSPAAVKRPSGAKKASAPRISGALLREVMSFPDKLRSAFPSLSETAMQAAFSKLSGQVLGEPLIPMPALEAHFYTASEIATEHGVSVNRVGRVSNEAGIPRDDSTGQMRLGKSEHSAKQVEQWFWSPAGKALVDDAIRAWKATQPSA